MVINYNQSSWAILAATRFWLALVVLCGHLNHFLSIDKLLLVKDFGGKSAVIGFLLISGLSIGNSYFKNPCQFYERRFLRIYPIYFFGVLMAVFLQVFLGSPYLTSSNFNFVSAGWRTSLANFIFLQTFFSITITFNGPLWSLAVEVFFYSITPFLARIRNDIIYVLIFASLSVFCLLFKENFLFGFSALKYGWAWLIGFLIASKGEFNFKIYLLLLLGFFAVCFAMPREEGTLRCFTYLVVVGVLYFCNNNKVFIPKSLRSVLLFLGNISYPLYVFHMPIGLMIDKFFKLTNSWSYIGVIIIVTIVLYYLLDVWLKKIFWIPLINLLKKPLFFFNLIKS